MSTYPQGLNYEGALRVHYHNGIEENMRALRITNNTTVSELIPMLIDKFKPESRSSKDSPDYNSHYMVMILDGGTVLKFCSWCCFGCRYSINVQVTSVIIYLLSLSIYVLLFTCDQILNTCLI